MNDMERVEEIKERLINLQVGKVIKYDNSMNLATQYLLDYSNDVTYLLSLIDKYKKGYDMLQNRVYEDNGECTTIIIRNDLWEQILALEEE